MKLALTNPTLSANLEVDTLETGGLIHVRDSDIALSSPPGRKGFEPKLRPREIDAKLNAFAISRTIISCDFGSVVAREGAIPPRS